MFERLQARGRTKASALLQTLETQLDRIFQGWLLVAGLACALRLLTAPLQAGSVNLGTVAPYLLLTLAPVASALLALRWFSEGHLQPQPSRSLAVLGKWRTVTSAEVRQHRLYGTSGLMVSLMVGMMLNVPMRALEYLTAMPPLVTEAPPWFHALHLAMTFDVVLFSSLYMIAFVAALKKVPFFPRLLAAIWIGDLAMQVAMSNGIGRVPDLPPAVQDGLHQLLEGNMKKVLISVALWLPYLLLSKRVNVTFRSRIPG
jgi:hypothetical protein